MSAPIYMPSLSQDSSANGPIGLIAENIVEQIVTIALGDILVTFNPALPSRVI